MAYTDDGVGLGRRITPRVMTAGRKPHPARAARTAKPPSAVYLAHRQKIQARKAQRAAARIHQPGMGAYSDDGLGKFKLKMPKLKKIFKPPKVIRQAVKRTVARLKPSKAVKAAFSKKNLMKNLKVAGIVAAVAGVVVGGVILGPAIIGKLGGKALSAAAKAAALKKKAGEVLSSDATPEQITQAAAQYDALPADQKPPLEPVQAVDASGAVVGVVPPTAYATVGAEYPAPVTGGMPEGQATVVTQEGGAPGTAGFPILPVAIGVVVLGGVLYMVFRKKR